jgi:flagellar basal-body rod modification protein FlgD
MLVTELQNQDPTSPMDPSQMVGQMFSMNQLQQLIDINQTLQSIAGYAPATAAGNATSQSTQPITGAQ